jgi:hypothetical protein
MTNLEKAQAFLSKIFHGVDARLPAFAEEMAKMLDQAEEEGKVRYMTELEAQQEPEAEEQDDSDSERPTKDARPRKKK